MKKSDARSLFLEKRKGLSLQEQRMYTSSIMELIKQHIAIPSGSYVLSYMASVKKVEMDMTSIHLFFVEAFGAKLALPRVNGDHFEAVAYDQHTKLHPSLLGIDEPIAGELIAPELCSLVLTPLIIFDKAGHRVGYGKGMYDRFFKRVNQSCIRLGCSFFAPIEGIEDVSCQDEKLSVGVCPDQIYFFNNHENCACR